jgi:hypothetical protein
MLVSRPWWTRRTLRENRVPAGVFERRPGHFVTRVHILSLRPSIRRTRPWNDPGLRCPCQPNPADQATGHPTHRGHAVPRPVRPHLRSLPPAQVGGVLVGVRLCAVRRAQVAEPALPWRVDRDISGDGEVIGG